MSINQTNKQTIKQSNIMIITITTTTEYDNNDNNDKHND